MKRNALVGSVVGVATLVVGWGAWWVLREQPVPDGPRAAPLGEPTRMTLPDAEGNPEEWTFVRREKAREEILPPVLPEPSPRDSPPDARSESARALDAEALEAWRAGELREALELFEAAVTADPDDWVPRADYGRLLLLMTDLKAAAPHLKRAAELAPENPRVWLDLLSLYERSVFLEGAFEARRKAQETAGGRKLVQDELTGLWKLEGESIFP